MYVIFIIHRLVQLFLEPNDRLISEDFVWQIRSDSELVTYEKKSPRRCHYMHRISHTGDGGVTAAFTYCPGSSKVSALCEQYSQLEFRCNREIDMLLKSKFIMQSFDINFKFICRIIFIINICMTNNFN